MDNPTEFHADDEFGRRPEPRSYLEKWLDRLLRRFGFHSCRMDPAGCPTCSGWEDVT